jgi:hypothetical protein
MEFLTLPKKSKILIKNISIVPVCVYLIPGWWDSPVNQDSVTNNNNTGLKYILYQLAKTLCPSYYCLYSLFNKIRDKGKIVSAW